MPVVQYPKVHGEYETLAKIKEGFSIARCGDGEFKVMEGGAQVREKANPILAKELRQIIAGKNKEHCLIGIPTMDPKGSKYKTWEPEVSKFHGWHRHKERFCKLLSPDVEYWSALITRPDCGEWMLTKEYAEAVQSIWLGKKVALIANTEEDRKNKLHSVVEFTQECHFIPCPYAGAYAEIDRLEKAALSSGCDMILISAGLTATCLANRLSPRVQAIDIGSIGGFLAKMLSRKAA